jgi:HD-GYP domain-containing protein (c-di-GMP phosphodiesterase class II)
VSKLSLAAADLMAFDPEQATAVGRSALLHDVGRVAVPARIWQKTGPLTVDDWEQVRLHAYHTERVLVRSPFLAGLAAPASYHHERLDGSGYHRGVSAPSLDPTCRLLAAADVYHAMTEPRPHREGLSPSEAADALAGEARGGRLDSEAVAAVLEAAGHPSPPIDGPAGLTDRELEVVRLLARGRQTKQVARSLQISVKTADSHIQNAYRKMGVSTRAGATLFAMQHGLVNWENSR